ncbi:hypothetical protein Hanom_Chr00s000001g01597541 [Helianthus anomalus]
MLEDHLTEDTTDWCKRTVKMEAKSVKILCKAKEIMSNICPDTMEIRYLGGLSILVTFGGRLWKEDVNHYERIAWVTIYGVPVSLRNNQNINNIARQIGKVVEVGEVSNEDGNLSFAHIGIIVNTGKLINTEVEVKYKETMFKCWISEVLGGWSPKFVNDDSVFVNCPAENRVDDENETPTIDNDAINGDGEERGPKNARADDSGESNPVIGDEEDTLEIGVEEDETLGNEEGVWENVTETENEGGGGEGETLNADRNFGGNWREIFAECMRNEKTTGNLSPRNNNDPKNKEDLCGDNGVIKFTAGNINIGENFASGPVLKNGPTVTNRSPNQKGVATNDGPSDDPFNLEEIIWASSKCKNKRKRKKGENLCAFTRCYVATHKRTRMNNGSEINEQRWPDELIDPIDRTLDLNEEPMVDPTEETNATLEMGKTIGVRISKFRPELRRIVQEELESNVES